MTDCTKCVPGDYLHNGICSAVPPPKTYCNGANICFDCDASCETCSTSSTCDTCPFEHGRHAISVLNFLCFPDCSTTQFFDLGLLACDSCSANCQSCINTANECSSCSGFTPTRYLKDGECIQDCGVGFYGDPSGVSTCEACHGNCKTCTSSSELTCTSCDPLGTFSYLYDGECLISCPANFI